MAQLVPGVNDLATTHPALAAQIAEDSPVQGNEVMRWSKKKVLWVCRYQHQWEAVVRSKSESFDKGCPYCSGARPIVGVNDLATTHPELVIQIAENSPIQGSEVTPGSSRKPLWVCSLGHEWYESVINRVQRKYACPYCSNNQILVGFNDLETTHPKLAEEVSSDSPVQAHQITAGSSKRRVLWICAEKHTWLATPNSRVNRHTDCPYCSGNKCLEGFNDLSTLYPHIATEISPKSNVRGDEVTPSSNRKLTWVCAEGHEWVAPVSSRSRGHGCPYCSSNKILVGYNDLATTHPEFAIQCSPKSKLQPFQVMAGSTKKLLWTCTRKHEWESTVANRVYGGNECPHCHASALVSKPERVLASLVRDGQLEQREIATSNRKLIFPYELDIYVPKSNLAIEFNGTYWHSEAAGKDSEYHYRKWTMCTEQGIDLVQVWSDVMETRPVAVRQLLDRRLGLEVNGRYHANDGDVYEISSEKAQAFFSTYHMSPYLVESDCYFALAHDYDGSVIAVAGFSEREDHVQLTQYAMDQHVAHGITRFVNMYELIHGRKSFRAILDLDFENGHEYEEAGWSRGKILAPSYSYFLKGRRVDNSQVDSSKALNRIWNSGHVEYTLGERAFRHESPDANRPRPMLDL